MEEDTTICPYCQRTVSYKWDNGFITEPHNTLIADWVYHSKCWDKQIEEYPPTTDMGETHASPSKYR